MFVKIGTYLANIISVSLSLIKEKFAQAGHFYIRIIFWAVQYLVRHFENAIRRMLQL
jgi:hypothetical protein